MTGPPRLSRIERIEDAVAFLILGAMKSGTTSLYRYLEQHPDVCFSEPKEPVFFEAEWEPGPRGLERYRASYFQGWRGERAVGEARTHNLGLPFVAVRVHQTLPQARLVAILRNPVDRAYSEWWHLYSHGQVSHDFEGGIEENLGRHRRGIRFEGEEGARLWREGLREPGLPVTDYGLYLDLGYYASQIERYLAYFPAEQLKLVFFEDLSDEPERVTREVWTFLGVDPDLDVVDTALRNPARDRIRSRTADRWGRRVRRLPGKDTLRRLLPEAVMRPWHRFVEGRAAVRPPMRPGTERFLLDHFAPHNRALESLTGRSLARWFETDPRRTSARGQAALADAEDRPLHPDRPAEGDSPTDGERPRRG